MKNYLKNLYIGGKIGRNGFKPIDALHLAFASVSKVDYFCTCDNKFLKKSQKF